jgi:hypothetical protein
MIKSTFASNVSLDTPTNQTLTAPLLLTILPKPPCRIYPHAAKRRVAPVQRPELVDRLASVEALAPVEPVVLGSLGPSVQRLPEELRFAMAQALARILLPPPLLYLGRIDVALAGSAAGRFGMPSNLVHVGLLVVYGYR